MWVCFYFEYYMTGFSLRKKVAKQSCSTDNSTRCFIATAPQLSTGSPTDRTAVSVKKILRAKKTLWKEQRQQAARLMKENVEEIMQSKNDNKIISKLWLYMVVSMNQQIRSEVDWPIISRSRRHHWQIPDFLLILGLLSLHRQWKAYY